MNRHILNPDFYNIWKEKISGNLELAENFKSEGDFLVGRHSVVLKPETVRRYLPAIKFLYPSPNIGLKVFFDEPKSIKEITQIQNIYASYGIAPQVYDLVEIQIEENVFFAQIVEFITGDYAYRKLVEKEFINLMMKIDEYKFIEHGEDVAPSNMIDGKWVDFGEFKFTDKKGYEEFVKNNFDEFATWGGKGAYQDCERLGIKGSRRVSRVELFGLKKYDFKGKTVLDIGCSGGYFTRYCAARGARAVGVDMPEVVKAAKAASGLLEVFNAEFYTYDLTAKDFKEYLYQLTGIQKYDYVFFLSMNQHIGLPTWFNQMGDTMFFESNGGEVPEIEYPKFDKFLHEQFLSVEFVGVSKEGPERQLFICKKYNK